MNTLKFLWVLGLLFTASKNPSKPYIPYNQLCIKCTFCNMTQWPFLAHSKTAFLAPSSCPYPIDMLMNLPLLIEMSYLAATFSTSGVGSTPGNSTKKMGTDFKVSSNTSSILKAGCSMYSSPIFSITYCCKAEEILSGLKVLNSSSLWKAEQFLKCLGKSACSAFSSEYHFFHYKHSVSKF